MSDNYSLKINQSYAVCCIPVPAWVNDAVVRLILSDPVFVEDVRNAHKKYLAIVKQYTNLIREQANRVSLQWASQYIPKTAPVVSIACPEVSMDIMLKVKEELPCVPFTTPDGGLRGDPYDQNLYDKERTDDSDVSNVLTLKVTGKQGSAEAKTFTHDAFSLSAKARFLFPSKARSNYRIEIIGLEEIPEATGRLIKVENGLLHLGMFSAVNGKNGGVNQEMKDEAESLYNRFAEMLEPTRLLLENSLKDWIESASAESEENPDKTEEES